MTRSRILNYIVVTTDWHDPRILVISWRLQNARPRILTYIVLAPEWPHLSIFIFIMVAAELPDARLPHSIVVEEIF